MATDAVEKTSTAITDALDALAPDEPVLEPESAEAPVETEVVDEPDEPAADEPADESAADLSELASEAKQYYGFSDAEIERAGDLLPSILARLDQQASVLLQGSSPEPAQAPPAKQEPAAEVKPLADLEAFDFAIDPDEWTENQQKILDAFKGEINKQRSTVNEHRKAMEMMAQLLVETNHTATEVKQRHESVSGNEFASSMDDFFAKLPDEFTDIYGKESMSSLSGNSPKVAARNALVKEMQILGEFDSKAGRPLRGIKEQAVRTLRALHADKAHQAARREVDKQIKTRRQSAIASPSSRAAKGNDPAARQARALAAIEKFAPKLGI